MGKRSRQKKERRRGRTPASVRHVPSIRPDQWPSESDRGLRLACRQCGHADDYTVGEWLLDPDDPSDLDGLGFIRVVWCVECGAGGPWKVLNSVPVTRAILLGLVGEGPPLRRARLRLFDGTMVQYASEGVEHLRRLLETNPDDPFLHDRLGNLWSGACDPHNARECWERALALDPGFAPSLFSLGAAAFEALAYPAVERHLHRLLLSARRFADDPRFDVRHLVERTLEILLDAHEETNGAVAPHPNLPELPVLPVSPKTETVALEFRRLDLNNPRDWDRYVDLWLPARGHHRTGSRPRKRPPTAANASRSAFGGRPRR